MGGARRICRQRSLELGGWRWRFEAPRGLRGAYRCALWSQTGYVSIPRHPNVTGLLTRRFGEQPTPRLSSPVVVETVCRLAGHEPKKNQARHRPSWEAEPPSTVGWPH